MRAALLALAVLLCGGCLSFDTDGKVFACDPSSGADCDGGGLSTTIGGNGSGDGSGDGSATTTSGSGSSDIGGNGNGNGSTSANSTTSGTTSGTGSATTGGYDDTYPQDVAIADVNRDGKMDLVTRFLSPAGDGDWQVVLEVKFGDGNGGFTNRTFVPLDDGGAPRGLEVTSLSDGGDANIFVGSENSTLTRIAFWPDGGFGTPELIVNTEDNDLALAGFRTGDLDGDGNADLVLAMSNVSGYVATLRGLGDGGFVAGMVNTVLTYGAPTGFVLGDFDGDHHLDMGYVWGYGAAIGWGAGDGGFSHWTPFDAGIGEYNIPAMAAADLNGDGIDDLLWSPALDEHFNSPYIHFGNAADPQQPMLTALQADWPLIDSLGSDVGTLQLAKMGDVNGDGVPDLLAVVTDDRHLDSNFRYYLLTPSGGLLDAGMPASDGGALGMPPINLAVGDLNGNGIVDAALTGAAEPEPVIILDP